MNDIEKAISNINYGLHYEDCGEMVLITKTAAQQAISALEQQVHNGWIPVTEDDEHYPESFETVLFTDGQDVFIGICDTDYTWISTNGENSIEIDCIIAWQPLPQPYQP